MPPYVLHLFYISFNFIRMSAANIIHDFIRQVSLQRTRYESNLLSEDKYILKNSEKSTLERVTNFHII